jgi:aldose 1-epimerase
MREIADTDLDSCFAGWDGRARIRWPRSNVIAEIDCDAPFRHLIVFTPREKPFFAIEPVSHANNGFNLLDGVADRGSRPSRRRGARARFGLRIRCGG